MAKKNTNKKTNRSRSARQFTSPSMRRGFYVSMMTNMVDWYSSVVQKVFSNTRESLGRLSEGVSRGDISDAEFQKALEDIAKNLAVAMAMSCDIFADALTDDASPDERSSHDDAAGAHCMCRLCRLERGEVVSPINIRDMRIGIVSQWIAAYARMSDDAADPNTPVGAAIQAIDRLYDLKNDDGDDGEDGAPSPRRVSDTLDVAWLEALSSAGIITDDLGLIIDDDDDKQPI